MDKIKQIEEILKEKIKQLSFDEHTQLITPFGNLRKALDELKKIERIESDKDRAGINSTNMHELLSDFDVKLKEDNPIVDSTLFNIISKLADKPFSATSVSFDNELARTVQIRRGENQPPVELSPQQVFTSLFPGGISFRWGSDKSVRIPCGRYSPNFVSHIVAAGHKVSASPITQLNGRNVFGLERITVKDTSGATRNHRGSFPICPLCLSLTIQEERCDHIISGIASLEVTSNLSPSIFLQNQEDVQNRIISEKKYLSYPLNEIFEEVSFLNNIKIYTIATGFSRTVSGVSIEVDYDPLIGYSIETKGIVFRLKKIPDEFLDEVLKDDFLFRDILIDILHEEISQILKNLYRSSFESELWVSGIIKTLELDSISGTFSLKDFHDRIKSTNFEQDFRSFISEELSYYERPPVGIDPALIDQIGNELIRITISNDTVRSKAKSLLKNSLSFLVYIAGAITSGSLSNELGFLYAKGEGNDIVVFDNSSGGNGASELINNYLVGEQTFNISKLGVKPKFFQETFFELLQPCSQGTADRIFFQNLSPSFSNFHNNNLITSKFEILNEQLKFSQAEFNQVRNSGIQNMFPQSIGKRALRKSNGSVDMTAHQKIQEIANICIHGCFECLLLNTHMGPPNPQNEKFFVSKYIVDLYFKYITRKIRIDSSKNISEIEEVLKKYDLVLISEKIKASEPDFSGLMSKVDSLFGQKIGNKLVKFSGIWFDCPISNSPYVEILIMFGLI